MYKKIFFPAVFCLLSLGFAACSDDEEETPAAGTSPSGEVMSSQNPLLTASQYGLLDDYVNNVVISTYSALLNASIDFYDKVNVLLAARTQDNVDAACKAWRSAREQWELSEAFLFGTASESQIDPHMDSWPLDNTQLARLLASNTFSSITGGAEARADLLRSNYGNSLMGFHAAEYVIFENGNPKAVAKISDEEYAYLQATALVLAEDCARLKAGWTGEEGLQGRESEIYNRIADDYGISKNYGQSMLRTGQQGSIYTGFSVAICEILGGMSDITDEVGNTKMENPIAKNSVLEVESWYSWNSLDDFENNLLGVRMAYTANNGAGLSVRQLVQAKSMAIDNTIMTNIETAITALEGIRAAYGSYRTLIEQRGSAAKQDANVVKAQAALADLTDALVAAQGYYYE